jgi:hypothetical protein
VKSTTHTHAFFASIDNPQKRYSSVKIAVVLSVRFLLEGIIATIAPIAYTPGTSMTGNQGTG